MKIKKIQGASREAIMHSLKKEFDRLGYDVFVSPENAGIDLANFRLSDAYVSKYGYNISPYTGHRGRVLGWYNWVQVNNTINRILDRMNVSANVHSLHGKFKVREGKWSFNEEDWEEFANENIGSIVRPVARRDAWLPEKESTRRKLESLE